jgi:hypothetical protein
MAWWRNRESNPAGRSCKDQLQPAAFPESMIPKKPVPDLIRDGYRFSEKDHAQPNGARGWDRTTAARAFNAPLYL